MLNAYSGRCSIVVTVVIPGLILIGMAALIAPTAENPADIIMFACILCADLLYVGAPALLYGIALIKQRRRKSEQNNPQITNSPYRVCNDSYADESEVTEAANNEQKNTRKGYNGMGSEGRFRDRNRPTADKQGVS